MSLTSSLTPHCIPALLCVLNRFTGDIKPSSCYCVSNFYLLTVTFFTSLYTSSLFGFKYLPLSSLLHFCPFKKDWALTYIDLTSKSVILEKPGMSDTSQSSVAVSMRFLAFQAKKMCKDYRY